jgi:O-antigen/teichoic acid export membrane protein
MVGRLLVVVAYDSRLRFTEKCPTGAVAVRCEWDWNMMWRLLQTAWPFGGIALLASLNGNIPRYFIEHQAGTRSLGIFAALYSLVAMGTLFINAFGQSVFMPAALSYAENDGPEFRRIIGRFTLMAAGLGVAAVVIAMLVGKQVLTLLYRPEYADRNLLVQLMIVGGIYWISTAQGYILTAVRVLREQIVLLVCAVAIAAGGCAWLVPGEGAMGAAHALQMSVAAQCVGGSILLWRANRKIEKCAVIESNYAASVELG